MVPARILVVDDDAWILRMVTTVLEQKGHVVDSADDGEAALARAAATPPDLIIADIMMPKLDGWGMIKRLRATPELAFVPVIFLTALGTDEDRIKGFRLGADDYLSKPFRFEELELRVAKVLRGRGQQKPAPSAGGAGLRGSLDQFGVSSLFLIMEMERKSGLLLLSRGADHSVPGAPPEVGRVYFREGRVVRARVDGQSAPLNAEAVYYFLTWPAGSFELTGLPLDTPDEINSSTTQLLLEGARRLDEAARPR